MDLIRNELYPAKATFSKFFSYDFDEERPLSSPGPAPHDFVLKLIRNDAYPGKAVFSIISY